MDYKLVWVNKEGINPNGYINTFDWRDLTDISIISRELAETSRKNRGIDCKVCRILKANKEAEK